MNIADRIANLGTETAFAVSAEAAAFAAKGNHVYPFHLGDMNLPTPSTVVEGAIKALRDGKTGYCPNGGIPQLREALADDISRTHGVSYTADNVAVQPGGKPVIGKFIQAVMNPGDEVLYPNPGYPIYESQIEYHGGTALPYGYLESDAGFAIDIDAIERQITPKTRVLVLNDLQNPIGAEASPEEFERLAAIVREHDLTVLCDEAYFEIRYSGESRSFVSLPDMLERCVILYTFSKKYAMTGWRLGAAVGPKDVIDVIAKLNVNDESCSNHFVQYGGLAGLTGDPTEVHQIVATLKQRRDAAAAALNAIEGVRCAVPEATFYLFPNVTGAMANRGFDSYDAFRKACLEATGVSFCTRLHFGRPVPGESERYIRLAYSGIDIDQIEEGLGRLKAFLES
ncbi:pyridoxal phosphate-dependent aminotransferase [Haloferula sp. A504]|uniref:pyridoxal phosphate-dependent aminotransferase n=1 Tax=Haloferula sp. A504 TaxID=3373601 RepID=UPI0031C18DB6|nr:aminotransferase class I/II-fold pyridoxal phosphate-dependent enzyme [Verrucomicrobiaceae bacterium E54]